MPRASSPTTGRWLTLTLTPTLTLTLTRTLALPLTRFAGMGAVPLLERRVMDSFKVARYRGGKGEI